MLAVKCDEEARVSRALLSAIVRGVLTKKMWLSFGKIRTRLRSTIIECQIRTSLVLSYSMRYRLTDPDQVRAEADHVDLTCCRDNAPMGLP